MSKSLGSFKCSFFHPHSFIHKHWHYSESTDELPNKI